jgi:GT2 family glycosyltransferase
MDALAGKRVAMRAPVISASLRSGFVRTGPRNFSGFVVDLNDASQKFAVEILVDGHPLRLIHADAPVDDITVAPRSDGCCGFSFSLNQAVIDNNTIVEARLANLGVAVGTPIVIAQPAAEENAAATAGDVRWLGGLRFFGYTARSQEGVVASVLVDAVPVTRVRASTWTHIGTSEHDGRAVRSFDFHLPDRFADGVVHRLTVADDGGESICGDPACFIAYADGLRQAVSGRGLSPQDKLRAELLDRLLPMSLPFSRYRDWREIPAPGPDISPTQRGAVIIVGTAGAEDTLETLREQTHDNWEALVLATTSGPAAFSPRKAEEFLRKRAAQCEFVVFAAAGTLLEPWAMARIAAGFIRFRGAQALYADVDTQQKDGSAWPLAFPAFDYERMLEQGYCAHFFALPRAAAERALKAGASSLYRLFNSVLDDTAQRGDIVHLPGTLATLGGFDAKSAGAALAEAGREHLQRKGIRCRTKKASAGAFPAVQIMRQHERLRTTVIIPTRNRQRLLQDCVDSIFPAIKRIRADLLIVDNETTDAATLRYFDKIKKRGTKVLRVPGSFNFSRLNNRAAQIARGEVLCLLNNDVKALDNMWLEEMLGRISAGDVGAVGALLVWPSGIVQHGGVVLGPSFAATHAFNDRVDGDVGYTEVLRVAHECSAVTAACMLTRRDDFLEVGGMDETRFPVNFNDVDYCLKLRAIGKRIVFTPHAKLQHLESASRRVGSLDSTKKRFERELSNLRMKWGDVLAADPYYSPLLALDPIPYSALAWPVRSTEPRINQPPVPTLAPPGL